MIPLDTADIAILETYEAQMNPVELGLLGEVRRLRAENEYLSKECDEVVPLRERVDELEGELTDLQGEIAEAQGEVEELKKKLSSAEDESEQHQGERLACARQLEDLKTAIRELVSCE